MTATINPQVLLKELKKMSLVVRKNNIIPITGTVLFDFKKDKLTLTGTDIETIYIIEIDCVCSEEFSFCVDYFDVVDICYTCVDDLKITRKQTQILISSGVSKFKLSVIGEESEFPNNIDTDFETELTVDGDFFYHLNNANTCRSKDEIKPFLNMAAIIVNTDYYDVVGCDGFIMYKKRFNFKNEKGFSVMVCDKFVNLTKNYQESILRFSSKRVTATYNNETIVSRLSESKYANISAIIPKDIDYNLSINKDVLRKSIGIVSTAASGKEKQFSLFFKPNELKLVSRDIELNKETETTIEANNQVSIESINLSASQLLHTTSLLDEGAVHISFSDSKKSVFIKPSNDKDVLILIQPLFQI